MHLQAPQNKDSMTSRKEPPQSKVEKKHFDLFLCQKQKTFSFFREETTLEAANQCWEQALSKAEIKFLDNFSSEEVKDMLSVNRRVYAGEVYMSNKQSEK
ncbi:hypothetical protein M5689_012822 [Euphorbia peplus]|nr:hypothetical protein M5689_012822 [Euphorbia peplus]